LGGGAGAEAALVNLPTGTYDIVDDSRIGLGASTASHIVNYGLFEKTGGTATSAVTAGIVNFGTIAAASGTLDLNGALTGTGNVEIDGPARLEADALVGAKQTFAYSGSGGDLVLDDLDIGGKQLFHGTISGFGAGGGADVLDVGRPFGAGTTFNFTEQAGGVAGTLAITDPTGEIHAAIHLLGDYSNANFALASDLHGGMLFTWRSS
jgi:hypothetical protein